MTASIPPGHTPSSSTSTDDGEKKRRAQIHLMRARMDFELLYRRAVPHPEGERPARNHRRHVHFEDGWMTLERMRIQLDEVKSFFDDPTPPNSPLPDLPEDHVHESTSLSQPRPGENRLPRGNPPQESDRGESYSELPYRGGRQDVHSDETHGAKR